MTNKTTSRRLTAILVADMVGYSRLVQLDEVSILDRQIECNQKIFVPLVAEFNGHIVRTTGDGFLIEFPSVINAVNCAIKIQQEIKLHESDVAEDRRIAFRIGVNLGDVIPEGGDIYGDGVNVAARIEPLAKTGGILISGSVFEQIEGKCDCQFKDLGERELKHIALPVHVYEVLPDLPRTNPRSTNLTSRGKMRKISPKLLTRIIAIGVLATLALFLNENLAKNTAVLSDATIVAKTEKPSIAVLPFLNMSGDAEQEYFVDGMTEDLITDLSNISALTVIARSSTFIYKGETPDISEVAEALNVSHVVEGSVRKVGKQIRITATLIDTSTGNHLWAERYDRDFDDIFAIQDDVRNRIIEAMTIQLTSKEEDRLAIPLTINAEAYDLYLQGIQQESFFTFESFSEAENLYKQAIALDPNFAAAYAHLAQVYSFIIENDWTDEVEKYSNLALSSAKKAVVLDGELPFAYWSLGRVYTRNYAQNLDKAIASFEKAIELNSNYADGYVFLGLSHISNGQAAKGLPFIEKGFRINPHAPMWYYQILGIAQFYIGNYDTAVKSFEQTIIQNATLPFPYPYLISAYGHLGQIDDAEWIAMEYEMLGKSIAVSDIMESRSTSDPVYRKMLQDGLLKAGLEM